MALNTNVITLFANQGEIAGAVSPAFQLNEKPSSITKPQLRTFGDLDGGSVVLQTLNSNVTLVTSDNTLNSTDWQDTDDVVREQGILAMNTSSLNVRVKVANLGASANWSAELIKD